MNMQPNAPPNTTPASYEVPQGIQNVGSSISQTYDNVSQSIKSSIDGFSEQAEAGVGASTGFLDSNTIIAKFAFLILIIIIFIFLLNLGIVAIQYFMTPSDSPYLINGMIDGNRGQTIPQDPKKPDSILIKRSNNESSGIEFTWSTWIRIDEFEEVTEKYQHVFHKGANTFGEDGVASTTNAPGLYIKQRSNGNGANTATLKVVMSTNASGSDNTKEIDDIPLQKWVHVIIRMQNTVMDVYINGTISGRLNLSEVPLQNYYDVQICRNKGFTGKLSNLRYYDYALNIFQITKVVAAGPNTAAVDSTEKLEKNYNYLSSSWYAAKV